MDRYEIALGKKPPPAVPLDKVSDKEWVVRRKQQQDLNLTREFLQYFPRDSETTTGQMISQAQELQRMHLEQEFQLRARGQVRPLDSQNFNDAYIGPAARSLARSIDENVYRAMVQGNMHPPLERDRTP